MIRKIFRSDLGLKERDMRIELESNSLWTQEGRDLLQRKVIDYLSAEPAF